LSPHNGWASGGKWFAVGGSKKMERMNDKKRILFIDRDGTLVLEPPVDYQLDNLEKLEFYPGVFKNLSFIREKLDFMFVMVTNQDGLGTSSFPEDTFWPAHNKVLKTFANEGVTFDAIHIDRSMPADNAPTRKPRTGMLTEYFSETFDLPGSFVLGDRLTDVELAKNLGCKAILFQSETDGLMLELETKGLKECCALISPDWAAVAAFLFAGERRAVVERKTKETDIYVSVDLDGSGKTDISTGLGFFDHMLDQIGKHSGIDLIIRTVGDLHVDEHHTIEDTAIALGEALLKALGDKRGVERYGYCLPMDDSLCTLALDFGGRPWIVWECTFNRERVGDVPTEMFFHFYKSLSDAAKMNLNVKAEGDNDHHKAEAIFKAFARSVKMAIRRDIFKFDLPSTKGLL
jgi:imidazoleglycerol-phosphate dehydratase / histidinol-phosphatase